MTCEGILLVDKPRGKPSFSLISALRKKLDIRKIGHAGTLDPFATGVMILLVGRNFTKKSDQFLNDHKEYVTTLELGKATDTFDCEGRVTDESRKVPTLEEIKQVLTAFQGEIQQTPPMFSAKKIGGERLYKLARKGVTVDRPPVTLQVKTELVSYNYPTLELKIACSKGTYIRTLADDIGRALGAFAHCTHLTRTRSGAYSLDRCIDGKRLFAPETTKEEIESKLILE